MPSVAKRRFLFDKFQNQPFVSDWRSAKSVEDNATLQFALPNMKIIEKALNPDVKSEICHTSSNPGLASSENINSENNFQVSCSVFSKLLLLFMHFTHHIFVFKIETSRDFKKLQKPRNYPHLRLVQEKHAGTKTLIAKDESDKFS